MACRKQQTRKINLMLFFVSQDLSESEKEERQLLIQRLQAELRTEEMRLVLLKKIRQTQLLAAQHQQQINLTPTTNINDMKSGILGLM